ncbi:HdeD family acid-resistance protein [Desertimonas flava]|uniref:HdeD family acid-resistance protein n=1 Tax=Desertimonas flava TaxID=2064846 RepID=UPI000E343438|nr:DUF308 domain-containing protein [Desertimonas flava]
MTMQVQGFSQTFVTPLLRRWGVVVALGVVMAAIGLLLLVNLFDAVKTLAVLVALGLAVAGVDEFVEADRHRVRWPSYVLGLIWLATAVVAIAWPGVTLWALAAMVGLGFIAGGLAEIAFVVSYRRALPMWGVWLLDGACSVLVGILALAWPRATILALAILLGLRVLFRGISTIMFGLSLRRIYRTTQAVHS